MTFQDAAWSKSNRLAQALNCQLGLSLLYNTFQLGWWFDFTACLCDSYLTVFSTWFSRTRTIFSSRRRTRSRRRIISYHSHPFHAWHPSVPHPAFLGQRVLSRVLRFGAHLLRTSLRRCYISTHLVLTLNQPPLAVPPLPVR